MAEGNRSLPLNTTVMRKYRGVNVTGESVVEEIEPLKTREDDVWVCSFPRSGTTLTQELVYLIVTGDFETANSTPLDDRFPFIDVKHDRFPYFRGTEHYNKSPSPRFVKTHYHYFLLPEQLRQGKGKIIYTARNPKDCLISCFHLLRWFCHTDGQGESFNAFFNIFMDGSELYAGSWWGHVKEYWQHKDDGNVLFLKFEDTRKDLGTTIRKIADFLGKSLTDDEVQKIIEHCNVDKMRSNRMVNLHYFTELVATDDTYGGFINKGIVGGWKERLNEDQSRQIDEMLEREFSGTGLTFDYE